MKYVNSKDFGQLRVVNWDLSRWEETYIEINHRVVWYWKYTWINRSRQRFDFQMSCYHAIDDMLNTISRDTYESIKWDLWDLRCFLENWYNHEWHK